MSFGKSFDAISARYGVTVAVERDGDVLGTGRALIQPVRDRTRQFVPSTLGMEREERFLCLGERSLPLEPVGELVLVWGEERFDVVNVLPITVAGETVYWRCVLERRAEEEAIP